MMWKTTVTCIVYRISLRIQQWNNFKIIVEVMIKNQVSFLEDSVYSSDCLMIGSFVFGRPFVKRFALCYRAVVCPVSLWRWCIVAEQFDGCGCHLVGRYTSAQATLCYMGTQPPPRKGHSSPLSHFLPMSIVANRSPISATAELL